MSFAKYNPIAVHFDISTWSQTSCLPGPYLVILLIHIQLQDPILFSFKLYRQNFCSSVKRQKNKPTKKAAAIVLRRI